nr:MAG TPA: LexA repressor [Caudoviricetes sp.]
MGQHEMRDRILQYISGRCDTDGCPPSYREIAAAVGLQSPSSVARHVRTLQKEGKLTAVCSPKGRTLRLKRRIDLDAADGDAVQRVRIETADGGVICVDCNLEKTGTDGLGVSFSGILDASQLKSNVCRVVRCSIDDGDV